MSPRRESGVYFSIHSPYEAVNPFSKGIFLKRDTNCDIYVKMEEEITLKAPFGSNCMDYEEFLEKNNIPGPRTKKMCEEKCYLDDSKIVYQCATNDAIYPHKERICGDETPENDTDAAILYDKRWVYFKKCIENCRDECRSLKYTAEYVIRETEVPDNKKYRSIAVQIYRSNVGVTVLRHSPKYETVDVISSIGGFMGCWLGVALLDILDVFGNIITVCRFAVRKRSNKEKIKAVVHVK